MNTRFSFTKKRLVAFICCSLLPFIVMCFGVVFLIKGFCFNVSLAVVHFLIPMIATAVFAWLIFDRDTLVSKIILTVIAVVVFIIVFLIGAAACRLEKVWHYENDKATTQYLAAEKNEQMPSLTELGETIGIDYYKVSSAEYIFSWNTNYLCCRYSPTEYENQKKQLDEKYIFQIKNITDGGSSCEPSLELEDYVIRALSTEGEYDESIYWPKKTMFIAFSDKEKEIIYISYEDTDLDYISSLKDFIITDCGWNYIR